MHEQLQQCIKECLNTHSACLAMVTYCLQKGGAHAEQSHIRLLLDCAEICQISENFMLRVSPFHKRTCGICAEICMQCAQDCARFGDDAQMQACADTCRRCAESCQQMAA
jgi:hypothetical protein